MLMNKIALKNQLGQSLLGLWPCYGIYMGLVFLLVPVIGSFFSFTLVSVVFFTIVVIVAKTNPELGASHYDFRAPFKYMDGEWVAISTEIPKPNESKSVRAGKNRKIQKTFVPKPVFEL